MRSVFQWNVGARTIELGRRTLIMGVVNITPDSFSDGGEFLDPDKAVAHGLRLIEEGADILDVGGESTRPGASVTVEKSGTAGAGAASHSGARLPVSAGEELKRILPVILGVKNAKPDAVISVDTYKAEVARAAVKAGAEIVNDVSGFRWDREMAKAVAELKCGAVMMHMRGRPEEWRKMPPAADIVLLVKRELRDWAESAVVAGVRRERLVVDPGFGFGKSFDENYPLISRFHELAGLGLPLLAGVSRKSFVGRTLARQGTDANPGERLYGTLAAQTGLILKGAHILRTHDVKPSLEAARVADAILQPR